MKRVIHENVGRPGNRPRWFVALMLLACVGVLSHPADAQLTWETTDLELRPSLESLAAGQTPVAVFRATNTGSYPLALLSVKAPRGWKADRLVSRSVRPGQSVSITLRPQSNRVIRPGERMHVLKVKTDEAQNAKTDLHLHVTVPQAVEVEGGPLAWEVGDKPTPKTVTLRLAEGLEKIEVNGAYASRFPGMRRAEAAAQAKELGFETEVEAVEPGRVYRVTVTPEAGAMERFARVWLVLDANLPDTLAGPRLPVSVMPKNERPEPTKPSEPQAVPSGDSGVGRE